MMDGCQLKWLYRLHLDKKMCRTVIKAMVGNIKAFLSLINTILQKLKDDFQIWQFMWTFKILEILEIKLSKHIQWVRFCNIDHVQ